MINFIYMNFLIQGQNVKIVKNFKVPNMQCSLVKIMLIIFKCSFKNIIVFKKLELQIQSSGKPSTMVTAEVQMKRQGKWSPSTTVYFSWRTGRAVALDR